MTSDPQALRRIRHAEYVREAGTEGIELVMWLVMRGALGKDVIERRRFYHVPASNTAVGHLVLECSGIESAAPSRLVEANVQTTLSRLDIDLYLTGDGAHRVAIPESAIQTAVQRCGHWERLESLNVPRTALLVVDMQNAFVVAGNPTSVPGAPRIIPNINQLARAVRAHGGLVVWLRMVSLPEDWSTLYGSFYPMCAPTSKIS